VALRSEPVDRVVGGGMRWLAVGIGTVFLLAACSSSGGDPGSSPPASNPQTAASVPVRNLKPQLLTVSDLPTGWAVDNSSDSGGGTAPPCVKNLKSKLDTTDHAEADFVKGTDVPVFNQQLGDYGTSAEALARYRTSTRILDGCRDFSFTSDGHKFTGSIGQLSFSKLGQNSDAWQIVLSAEGLTLGLDVVLVQKGTELALFLYGDFGTPDMSEFTQLVNKALARVPAT
jgi:hypothetical protein